MSVVSNPLIGASKQKMGNAVFSTWKGINVLKTKPLSVANPRTDGQLVQRSGFSILVEAYRQMSGVVTRGFKELAIRKSEFNAFMSYNLKNAIDYSTPPTAILEDAALLISKGSIAVTPVLTVVADRSSNTIVATFATTADQPGQSLTDVALIAAWNSVTNEFTGAVTTAARSTGTASIDLPASWATGQALSVYVGFSNPLTKKCSDSQYTLATIVA